MKRKIIGQKRQVLILVVMGLWSSVSAAEDSPTRIKEKLKQGCEMTVSFNQGKNDCKMIVKIKEDFEDVEKGISIQMWQGCFYGYETRHGGSYLRFNDTMVYRKFKKGMPEESMLYIWDRLLRRRRKIDMDLKALDYFGFTYAELFKAVEELLNKDEVKLGEYTVVVKRREFKDIHRDDFFLRLTPLSE
ncbi:MAG: hypothetical protein ACYTFM_13025 [Planctomycetota bacterium]|jgi:hypothetical protein